MFYSQKDTPLSLVDLIHSSTISAFAKAGGLDDTFIEVGTFLDWKILSPSKDERVCDKHDIHVIPFYVCVFSTMGFHLPLVVFKIVF